MSRDLIRLLRQQPTLLRRVRLAAAAKGITLSQLAELSGVNVSVLSRGLRERQILSDTNQAAIASVLAVPVAELFDREPVERAS